MRELKKGSLGMLLLQLLRERPSYGYELCERLRARSGGVLGFDEGAIYPLLHDYERRGLVISYWESSGAESPSGAAGATSQEAYENTRKGPRRRYYRMTDRGREALEVSIAEWRAFANAVGRVLEGGDTSPAGLVGG